MSDKVSRRHVMRLSAMAAALPFSWNALQPNTLEAATPQVDYSAPKLTSYLNGGQVLLRWNNFVVAAYRANPTQKYPYFTDLLGPVSGLSLTTESSVPFPHHRGLWLGCEPLNGGDYWGDGGLKTGQIRSVDLKVVKATSTTAELQNRCQWERHGSQSPFCDDRSFKFQVLNDRVRILDCDIKITALQAIQIKRAKHSFFALRVAPDLSPLGGGTLVNSEGAVGEAATLGKPASWCGYYGRRASRPDVVEGIALMEHPENPWSPCPWFTRDYGHLSPSPFNFLPQPWELSEGASLRLRYRVVLHAGDPQEAGMNQLYKNWVTTVG